jgi:5'-nucleotidase
MAPSDQGVSMTVRRSTGVIAAVLVLALFGAGCSSEESGDASTTTTEATTTSAAAAEVLTILVSNDDGYGAPGIDAVVRALSELPDTELVVVAPKENQSGSGSKTTEGELEVAEVQTASGFPATSVAGFPADAVNWALDGGIDVTPDVVITGVNSGQNLGAVGDQLSGTIGAARAGAARDIPALASSTATEADDADYDAAAQYVVEWVQERRQALLDGQLTGAELVLQSLNVPVCTEGAIRSEVQIPVSTSTEGAIAPQDCTSTLEDPADDIEAFNNGFVTISDVTLEPAPAG